MLSNWPIQTEWLKARLKSPSSHNVRVNLKNTVLLLRQKESRMQTKVKKIWPRVPNHRSKVPPRVTRKTSNILKEINIQKVMDKKLSLHEVLKKKLQKQISNSPASYQASYEEALPSGRTFRDLQKDFERPRKLVSILRKWSWMEQN